MRQYQGLSREQIEDMAEAQPDDTDEASKKRMITVATRGDLGILRRPRTISGKVMATDFFHMENLSDLQEQPDLNGPTSFDYGDVLQNAIKSAQSRRSRFTAKASAQQRFDIDRAEAENTPQPPRRPPQHGPPPRPRPGPVVREPRHFSGKLTPISDIKPGPAPRADDHIGMRHHARSTMGSRTFKHHISP